GMLYLQFALPNVGPAPVISIDPDPERIERGQYLANHVMVCIDCHSTRDWTKFSGPIIPGTEGKGGELFDQNMGFPGAYYSVNLTSTNLGKWTDGEIFRAITTGVSKDGHALFNIMPYHNFGQCDEEDIFSIIAYIRSLEPIDHETPLSSSDFPINLLINNIPRKANLQPKPNTADAVAYGKYLATAASCYDCHTNQEKGQFIGEPYAGGMRFIWPNGSVTQSLNITPHASGIGSWTETQFVQRFKAFADSNYVTPPIGPGDFQTPMPWEMYAGMEEEDLKAIFAYLKTIEPVDNTVQNFIPSGE
ncbi:MAG: cytochrome c, partial [Bacteroidia bacterium]|nr:cytochrome c [Bacteroidia bacterium]